MDQPITFIAEIKKVEAKKLISNDIEFRLSLVSPDPNLLDLAKYPPDVAVKVIIEPS